MLIEPDHLNLSITEQCFLIGLPRSCYYYKEATESSENLQFMRMIDELYLKYPAYGYRRMQIELKRSGHNINGKRTLRLMQIMGIQSILPKKNLSASNKEHKKYPYLLNGFHVTKPLQVYSIDITYIPMLNGFLFLTAIIDVYSRSILSWEISNSLDVSFCLDTVNKALSKYGKPEIFNMDQGSQFTCEQFLNILIESVIKISMDGKGRAIDNIFIERFWWSLKYEIVYPSQWTTVSEAIRGINEYIEYYNNLRPHQSLGYATPNEILTGKLREGFGQNYKGLTTRKR